MDSGKEYLRKHIRFNPEDPLQFAITEYLKKSDKWDSGFRNFVMDALAYYICQIQSGVTYAELEKCKDQMKSGFKSIPSSSQGAHGSKSSLPAATFVPADNDVAITRKDEQLIEKSDFRDTSHLELDPEEPVQEEKQLVPADNADKTPEQTEDPDFSSSTEENWDIDFAKNMSEFILDF